MHACMVNLTTSSEELRTQTLHELGIMGHFKITVRGISKEKKTLILPLTTRKLDSKIDGPLSKQTTQDQLSAAFLSSVMSICISKQQELRLPDCGQPAEQSYSLVTPSHLWSPAPGCRARSLDRGPLFMHLLQLGKSLLYSTNALTLGSSAKSLWPQPWAAPGRDPICTCY